MWNFTWKTYSLFNQCGYCAVYVPRHQRRGKITIKMKWTLIIQPLVLQKLDWTLIIQLFYTINLLYGLCLVTEMIYGCMRKNNSFCCELCWRFSVLEAYIDVVPIDSQANMFLGRNCIWEKQLLCFARHLNCDNSADIRRYNVLYQ